MTGHRCAECAWPLPVAAVAHGNDTAEKIGMTTDELRCRLHRHVGTEGERAIDVFHITKGTAKLTADELRALTTDLERTLEDTTL